MRLLLAQFPRMPQGLRTKQQVLSVPATECLSSARLCVLLILKTILKT